MIKQQQDTEPIFKDFLNHISNFNTFTEDCIKDVLKYTTIVTFDKNEKILVDGKQASNLYFIHTGCLKVFRIKNEKEVVDWFGFEKEFVTPVPYFFNNQPSKQYIVALEKSAIVQFSREDIFQLANKHHCFETFLLC